MPMLLVLPKRGVFALLAVLLALLSPAGAFGQDCCTQGRLRALMLRYIAEDCSASQNAQNLDCFDFAGLFGDVFIIGSDKEDPDDGNALFFFTGNVSTGETFVLDSRNASEPRLKDTCWVHVLDEPGGTLLQSVEIRTKCDAPLFVGDQFGSLVVDGCLGESEGSCCTSGKPRVLRMQYTADDCSATYNGQQDNDDCNDFALLLTSVFIVSNDNANPGSGNTWFSGDVNLDETFDIDATNAGQSILKDDTFIHVFDQEGGALLQRIEFRTKCDKPIYLDDQYGSALVVNCVGEDDPTDGACCFDDGTCQDVSNQTACNGAGGLFEGAGFVCATVTCPISTGSCCFPDAACLEFADQDECSAVGGAFQGPGTTCTSTEVPVRVTRSADDAEENSDTGQVDRLSSDLELGIELSGDPTDTVGMRFLNLAIPPGATITSASIQFRTDEITTGVADLTIRGQAADDPGEFNNSDGDITDRPTTSASTSWSPPPWDVVGESGPDQRTPDIAAVIQEIVDRPGWSSGNAIVIIVTGTGTRTAEAYDGLTSAAPLLRVQHGGSTCPLAPGACCLADGSCQNVADLGACDGVAGVFEGHGSDCAATSCPVLPGACCDPDGSCENLADQAACDATGGVFQGHGTDCGGPPCPVLPGACCQPDGACSETADAGTCTGLGGLFRGHGTDCGSVTCDPLPGACCLADGTCLAVADRPACAAAAGSFEGHGTDCASTVCPAGACCLPDVTCTIGSEASCDALSGTYQGDGSDCGSVQCPVGPGACCVPDGTCFLTVDEPTCDVFFGVFQGVNTDCVDVDCPLLSGACCQPDGSCTDAADQSACDAMGGLFEGAGTACAGAGCETGACCFPDGDCFDFDDVECASFVGVFGGFGTECAGTVCPVLNGACCQSDGSCSDAVEGVCEFIGGTFQGEGTECAGDPCPVVPGACCLADGACNDVDAIGDCDAIGGLFLPALDCATFSCPVLPSACCHADGTCSDEPDSVACDAIGGTFIGHGTDCFNIVCTEFPGACCLADASCTEEADADACAAAGGVFEGHATDCATTNCPLLSGACCFADGSCSETADADACVALEGQFEGPGTDCGGATCPILPGACCFATGECFEFSLDECSGFGGDYNGPGSTCSQVSCPVLNGACCQPDGGCADIAEPVCLLIGGNFTGEGTECELSVCPIIPGACCHADGFCEDVANLGVCQVLGGTFLQHGVDCASAECPILGACCQPDGVCTLEPDEAECTAIGGLYSGPATDCLNTECPILPSACCLADDTCIDVVDQAECDTANGLFAGHGTVCATTVCPLAPGACCYPGQICTNAATESACDAANGNFQGYGTDCASTVCPIGADLITGTIGGPTGIDVKGFGTVDDISAYAIGTSACNAGGQVINWDAKGPDGDRHPVVAQNLYRLKDDRFEQIGMSWIKHGFCAVDGNVCFACVPAAGCDVLGIGCSDTYGATVNGSFFHLGPRSEINPVTGEFAWPHSSPSGDTTTRGRIQVQIDDVDPALNGGALYFGEGHYLTADDAGSPNGRNNVTHRPVNVGPLTEGIWSLSMEGTVSRELLPAIEAWGEANAAVTVAECMIEDSEELFMVGFLCTQTDQFTWHYEYAVYNMNSDRAAGRFSIPVPDSVTAVDVGFHDVDYHSGEIYDSTDWTSAIADEVLAWATDTFETNENANALRWGTLYNFRFDADSPPETADAVIGLFRPGTPDSMTMPVCAPRAVIPGDVFRDGDVDFADLLELIATWGPCPATPTPCPADFDGDGNVLFGDLVLLLSNWGAG